MNARVWKTLCVLLVAMLPLAACVSVRGAWSLQAIHQGIHQDGRVQQVGELPCFAVADSAETRQASPKLALLDVYQRIGGRADSIWALGLSGNPPVSLTPDACIVYGDTRLGRELTGPAPTLRSGVAYSFWFNSDIPARGGDGWINRRYEGYFCLTRDAAGKTQVHDVRWDKKAEKRRWDVCGIEDGP
ncbi:hypothetical protein [Pseudoxanthomonas putridarboris]|uniref:Lipoprotein n=1 Tax=Pseudoxanthomonas putridarboris TaxID=752605 RepID=A0ABU9J549_9GAMM